MYYNNNNNNSNNNNNNNNTTGFELLIYDDTFRFAVNTPFKDRGQEIPMMRRPARISIDIVKSFLSESATLRIS